MRTVYRRMSAVLLTVCMLCSFLLSACSMETQEQKMEDLRDKLILAFQYLENMEYDSALDAFAQVLDIDARQVDAYIGIARASSAKGRHKEAADYVKKGYEETGNRSLEEMAGMYDRITENEDLLKETAALLEDAENIPEEIGNAKTGLLSETLDRLWETLDGQVFCDLPGGFEGVILYPVDAEKGVYLILYPSGYYYLGNVIFGTYESFLAELDAELADTGDAGRAQEILLSESRDLYTVPKKAGSGVWAGLNEESGSAVFYTGGWTEDLPNDEDGFCAVQILPSGTRFVADGPVYNGKFNLSSLNSFFSSQDEVMEMALHDGVSVYASMYEGFAEEDVFSQAGFFAQFLISSWSYVVLPFEQSDPEAFLMKPASRSPGLYSSDFENRRYFEMIDAGSAFRALVERSFLIPYEAHRLPVEGDLLQLQGYPADYNADHDLYIIYGRNMSAVIDDTGRILSGEYEPYDWSTSLQFNTQGFSRLVLTEEGTENIYRDPNDADGNSSLDVWQMDYDWEGNETGRKYIGKQGDLNRPFHENTEIVKDAKIRAEMKDYGILVTDSDGNESGRILIDLESGNKWTFNLFGRMISLTRTIGEGKSVYTEEYLFLAAEK